jgi:Tol biopolymer transport system component/DNA-binding winged helix-turn-helix (wHTH) protein
MNLQSAQDLRIGAWLVEPSLLRACRGAEVVRLEPKTLQVLLCLAARPGEVVAKEELHREVWEGAYAAEDGLRRAILQLRRLLGDEAKAPGYIETVPRLGYRLLVEPQTVDSGNGLPPTAGAIGTSHWRRLRWLLAAGGGLAALVAIAWVVSGRSAEPAEGPPFGGVLEVVPLTTYRGLEHSPGFSPDGSQVVFVWEREDEGADLFVKRVDGEMPLQLTSREGREGEPAWSPDGRWIGFSRRTPEASELLLVPPLGGGERLLVRLAPAPIQGLSWTPDSATIVFAHGPHAGTPSTIFKISVGSLEVAPLTHPSRGMDGDRRPDVSPDGSRLAFVRSAVHGLDDIYLLDLASPLESEPRRLTHLQRKITDLAWHPDGRNLLSTQLHAFHYGLWRVPVDGGAVEEIAIGEDNSFHVAVSAAGDRIAFARERYDTDIWRYPLSGAPGESLIASTQVDYGPDVSAVDGRLLFLSKRSGAPELWLADPDGGEPRRLTDFGGPYVGHARWSPHGDRVVLDARGHGNADIYSLSPAGEAPRRLTADAAEDVAPNWSRDGDAIYFASNRSGEWQVWRVAAAGGEPEQVTRDGGFYAAESLDGRFLYYAKMHHSGIYRAPIEGGVEELFVPELSAGAWGNWLETPEGFVLVTGAEGGGWEVARVRPGGGPATRLLRLERWPPNPGLALGPGGLLMTRVENVEGDLMLARPSGDANGTTLLGAPALSSPG